MKLPGKDHPITITANDKRVQVRFNGRIVADTTRAKTLKETTYPPMHYIPREDADMSLFVRTDHTTHCPYKGDAAYYSIKVGDKTAENAIWTYEQPYPAVAEIAGHLAFYRQSRRCDRRGGVTMKLAVPDMISNSYFPAEAAIELGFFREEGLDVALQMIFPVDKCYQHAARRRGRFCRRLGAFGALGLSGMGRREAARARRRRACTGSWSCTRISAPRAAMSRW